MHITFPLHRFIKLILH